MAGIGGKMGGGGGVQNVPGAFSFLCLISTRASPSTLMNYGILIYLAEDVRMLVGSARAKGIVPFKSILACDPLPISPISFGRF